MPVVGSNHGILYPRCGQLADGARQIVDYRVHHLSSRKSEAGFSSMIDLLRPDDDHSGTFDLLGQPRRLKSKQLVETEIDQPRYTTSGEFPAAREIGQKCLVDAVTKFSALLGYTDAARRDKQQSGHANRSDARERRY